jgi:hypothetical protein
MGKNLTQLSQPHKIIINSDNGCSTLATDPNSLFSVSQASRLEPHTVTPTTISLTSSSSNRRRIQGLISVGWGGVGGTYLLTYLLTYLRS